MLQNYVVGVIVGLSVVYITRNVIWYRITEKLSEYFLKKGHVRIAMKLRHGFPFSRR